MLKVLRVPVAPSVVTLLASEIVLISTCYVAAVFLHPDADAELFLLYEGGMSRVALVVISVLLGLYYQNLYSDIQIRSGMMLLQQLSLVIGIAFLLQAVLTYMGPGLIAPRLVMIIGSGLLLIVLPVWRLLFTRYVVRTLQGDRVLFLGANRQARDMVRILAEKPAQGIVPLAFLVESDTAGDHIEGLPVAGRISDVREVVSRLRPDRVIVSMHERRGVMPTADLLDLRFRGVRIQEAAALFEAVTGRVPIAELRPSQLIFSAELGPHAGAVMRQQWISFVIAMAGLVLAGPVMLLVALAVRLTSPGPVLYRQRRIGLNGRPFTVYKFRSMVANAEAGTGAVWASKNDPRVTPIGGFLRRTRLDELPQIFNVLQGEMVIVGPRPERPEFVEQLSEQIPFYPQRHCVRPGITGWAQVNHKYGDTIEDTVIKLEYDLYYIKNLSLALDLYIIFQTIKVMLASEHGQ